MRLPFATLLFTLLLAGNAAAATPQTVTFPSVTAVETGNGIELTGYLFVPEGAGPFPAVILMHGCSGLYSNSYKNNGLSGQYQGWSEKWLSHGYIVLLVDSLWPRYETHPDTYIPYALPSGAYDPEVDYSEQPLRECSNGEHGINEVHQRAYDAHAAKEFLLTESGANVDPARVFLQGWSHGASAAMAAMHSAHAGGTTEFRAAVVSYPGCNVYGAMPNVRPTAPLLILHAENDPLYAGYSCDNKLANAQADDSFAGFFEMAVYSGADHSFEIASGNDNAAARVHAHATTVAFFEHLHTNTLPQEPKWSKNSPFLSARPYVPSLPPVLAQNSSDSIVIANSAASIDLQTLFDSPLDANLVMTLATANEFVTLDGDNLHIDLNDVTTDDLPLRFAIVIANADGQRVQMFEVQSGDEASNVLVLADSLNIDGKSDLQFPSNGILATGDVPLVALLDGNGSASAVSATGLPAGLMFEAGLLTGDMTNVELPFNFTAQIALPSGVVDLNVTASAHPTLPDTAVLNINGVGNISVSSDDVPTEYADLSASMTAPARAIRGGTANVLVGIGNNGPDTATDVSIALRAPEGWTINNVDNCETADVIAAWHWICNVDTLAAGTTTNSDMTVSIPATTPAETATFTISVSATTNDPASENNADSVNVALENVETEPQPQPEPPAEPARSKSGGGVTPVWLLLALLLLNRRRTRYNS